jgi:hypothetical protein
MSQKPMSQKPMSQNTAVSDSIQAHLERIKTSGFTVLEKLIPSDLINAVKSELEPYLRGELMGRNNFEGFESERVYALLAKAPSVANLVEHPEIV